MSQARIPAVELRGVSKRFGREERRFAPWSKSGHRQAKVALEPLDLDIPAGGVTGVIGPNGSGKSTLVRMLATLLLPDTGSVRVFGHDAVRSPARVRRHVNRVSVEASFFKEMSPWENLAFSARLYGAAGRGTRARVESLLRELGLPSEALDQPMKRLSRGQQQKVAIARSFLTTPNLLLMDEPTTGLDPRSKREVQALLAGLRSEREVTVLLCTHDLDEAELLCDRVMMLAGGRVIADGTPSELLARHSASNLEELFLELTGTSVDEAAEEDEAS